MSYLVRPSVIQSVIHLISYWINQSVKSFSHLAIQSVIHSAIQKFNQSAISGNSKKVKSKKKTLSSYFSVSLCLKTRLKSIVGHCDYRNHNPDPDSTFKQITIMIRLFENHNPDMRFYRIFLNLKNNLLKLMKKNPIFQ